MNPEDRHAFRWKRLVAAGVSTVLAATAAATFPWNAASPPSAQAEEAGQSDGAAQTAAAAREEAVSSGQPVEVLSERSERRDVVANPDGTFTASEHAAPVRARVGGEWRPIDTTLSVDSGNGIRPASTTLPIAFSEGGSDPLVTVRKSGSTFELDWEGDLPEPTVEGDSAHYADVLPGVDLVVTALAAGFTHTLVVTTAEAAANPALDAIDMPVTVDGVSVENAENGGMTVRDAGDEGVWMESGGAVMWDSSGIDRADSENTDPGLLRSMPESVDTTDVEGFSDTSAATKATGRKTEFDIDASDTAIGLRPDQAMLEDPDTVFPVFIDPVYHDYYRSAWAAVFDDYPHQEYWKWSNSQKHGGVGTWNDGASVKRQYIRVPTSRYRGKDILSAELAVAVGYNWYHDNHATGYNVNLRQVSGFSSSTNWNNMPSSSYVTYADAPAADGGQCKAPTNRSTSSMEWGITSTVQEAADDGKSSLSFEVRNYSEKESKRWLKICNNATLRVKYNTKPDQAPMDELRMNPGPVCAWNPSDGSRAVNELPTLYATLTDPDHGDTNEWGSYDGGKVTEQLKAKWELTDADDAVLWSGTGAAEKASGSEFELDLNTVSGLADKISDGTEVRWQVKAVDQEGAAGPWSGHGSPTRCRFWYDADAPDAPTISSQSLPQTDADGNEVVSPMVGQLGELTLSTTSTDVFSYRYDFLQDESGPQTVSVSQGGDPATITYRPLVPGRHVLQVTALDNAGNGTASTYSFRVSAAAPDGHWTLTDSVGSTTATDEADRNPGTPGGGVTFGVNGPGTRSAASFDGTIDAYVSTTSWGLTPTGASVSMAAWARVDDLSRDGVIAAIGSTGEAGMMLAYESTSTTGGRWKVAMADMPLNAFAYKEAAGGIVSESNQDEWVHLTGVYNSSTEILTLFANGKQIAQETGIIPWWGDGTVQIGRAETNGAYGDNFSGGIADVRVYDRVVPAPEAAYLGQQVPARKGLWQFSILGEGRTVENLDGGAKAVLSETGSEIYRWQDAPPDPSGNPPSRVLVGDGYLKLDSAGQGYASVPDPMIDSSRSFSLSLRAKLNTAHPEKAMTVMSLPGANESAITLSYDPAANDNQGGWVLRAMTSDAAGAETVSIVHSQVLPTDEDAGQLLSVVYDGITGQLRLYVDGQSTTALAEPFTTAWKATGDIQIGRGFASGSYNGYFHGGLDDFRIYQGVLDDTSIQRLNRDFEEFPDI
ncbi:LamG-like jellyroll fold domain-containing protein [Salininema proteolyticum]|uniref:LamG-like jellyroll fold domain-containing protein n=1 Tax=Salininema proteolyticum TaxID=1607685 RepID=A0ABV8U3C7_9ACTN